MSDKRPPEPTDRYCCLGTRGCQMAGRHENADCSVEERNDVLQSSGLLGATTKAEASPTPTPEPVPDRCGQTCEGVQCIKPMGHAPSGLDLHHGAKSGPVGLRHVQWQAGEKSLTWMESLPCPFHWPAPNGPCDALEARLRASEAAVESLRKELKLWDARTILPKSIANLQGEVLAARAEATKAEREREKLAEALETMLSDDCSEMCESTLAKANAALAALRSAPSSEPSPTPPTEEPKK